MTTYYVATLACYVLVDAANEEEARERGHAALVELDPGRKAPLNIRTIRPATSDEIEFWQDHHDSFAREQAPMTPRPGDRVRLLAMRDDPDPIPVGQVGTVIRVARHGGKDAWDQIEVAWDNGRTLMLVSPPDRFEIVQAHQPKPQR